MAVNARTLIQTGTVTSTTNLTSYDVTDQQSIAIVSAIVVPSAASATVKSQWSLDETNWVDIDTAVAFTGSITYSLRVNVPEYRFIRTVFTFTSGSFTHTTSTFIRSYTA